MELSMLRLVDQIETEDDAYRFLEGMRWADKPVCPHCGVIDDHYFLTPKDPAGRKTRTGNYSQRRVWKCKSCRRQFSATTGTVFHGSKLPLRKWLLILFDMCTAKNGISCREVERKYDVTPKAAWFALHRLREAMRREPLAGLLTGEVEVDETYYGPKARGRHGIAAIQANKKPIVTLISRETGEARSQYVERVTSETLAQVVREHMTTDAILMTDGHKGYLRVGPEQAEHHRVNHAQGEYARTTKNGRRAHINAAEGYFSRLKRSLNGTYHHVSLDHLDRYLAEFDYRWSTRKLTDTQRMQRVIAQAAGRRLTYRPLIGD